MMRRMGQWIDLERIFGKDPANFDLADLNPAFKTVTDVMFGLAGTLALLFLIVGGIMYITAGGNSEQANKAKGTITWAFVGLVVVIAAYAIVRYFAEFVFKTSPF